MIFDKFSAENNPEEVFVGFISFFFKVLEVHLGRCLSLVWLAWEKEEVNEWKWAGIKKSAFDPFIFFEEIKLFLKFELI